MRGARAAGGRRAVDDIGGVDAARAFLRLQYRLAGLADVGGILDLKRPVASRPPDDRAALQIVAGQKSHEKSLIEEKAPGAPRQSSASARAATLPTMISAGLCTFSRATRSPRSASKVRSTRASALVPRSTTATGRPGDTPSAISLSAMAGAVARPM